jgi:hypothetical protein
MERLRGPLRDLPKGSRCAKIRQAKTCIKEGQTDSVGTYSTHAGNAR